MEKNNRLVVILGPTASGKTDLSIKLARKFKGEVVSADSRQVYKGMDIGSGKITKKEMKGIPHYLLDVANPKNRFTVAQYQKMALKTIKNIQKRGKLPFLVGGTGFYIRSIVDGIVIPDVKPNWKLRKKLEELTTAELFEKLKKLDPKRAESIDRQNPRRLVRALEIVLTTNKPVQKFGCRTSQFDCLQIGILKTKRELKTSISRRLQKRLKNNRMINEVKKLHKSLSWKRLEEFGLEYRFVAQYLSGYARSREARQKMIDNIQKESEHLVKKQMTWFKSDKRIKWVKNYGQAEKLVKNFTT